MTLSQNDLRCWTTHKYYEYEGYLMHLSAVTVFEETGQSKEMNNKQGVRVLASVDV